MQVFFSSLSELESFTHQLHTLSKDNACQYCNKNDQWVSHGYIYKQTTIDQRNIVGKRIVCAQRFGKRGCGRTRQLYLGNTLPRRHTLLSVVLTFISQLIRGASVRLAYHHAIGHERCEPRQAWRWLNALRQQLPCFRVFFKQPTESQSQRFSHRVHRLRVLLPTLQMLLSTRHFQLDRQKAFI